MQLQEILTQLQKKHIILCGGSQTARMELVEQIIRQTETIFTAVYRIPPFQKNRREFLDSVRRVFPLISPGEYPDEWMRDSQVDDVLLEWADAHDQSALVVWEEVEWYTPRTDLYEYFNQFLVQSYFLRQHGSPGRLRLLVTSSTNLSDYYEAARIYCAKNPNESLTDQQIARNLIDIIHLESNSTASPVKTSSSNIGKGPSESESDFRLKTANPPKLYYDTLHYTDFDKYDAWIEHPYEEWTIIPLAEFLWIAYDPGATLNPTLDFFARGAVRLNDGTTLPCVAKINGEYTVFLLRFWRLFHTTCFLPGDGWKKEEKDLKELRNFLSTSLLGVPLRPRTENEIFPLSVSIKVSCLGDMEFVKTFEYPYLEGRASTQIIKEFPKRAGK